MSLKDVDSFHCPLALGGEDYDYLSFTGEETEAERENSLSKVTELGNGRAEITN